MTQLRVALVGAGDIGSRAHLPALLAHSAIDLAVVVDGDARARARADMVVGAGTQVSGDLAAALDDESIRAWVVATPPWVTPALVEQGLCSGRFVLAEKPIACDLESAAGLEALSEAERGRLQMGFTYRHDPAFERLRDWVVDDRFGGPLLVRVVIYDEPDNDTMPREYRERMNEVLARGLPIVHEGAHVADWLQLLLGGTAEFEIEHSWSLRTIRDLPNDNICGASLSHPDGHRVLIEIGWLVPVLPASSISIAGPGGYAELDVMSFDLTFASRAGCEHYVSAGDRTTRCFRIQLDRFVQFCGGGMSAAPGFDDGLASLRLTERIAADIQGAR